MMKTAWTTLSLSGTWQLAILKDGDYRRVTPPAPTPAAWENSGATVIPGTVPGNFELDMLAAGLLEDPFYGDNILKMRELEDRHLLYYREFEAAKPADTDPVLVLEGVDTVADVYLDGACIGHTDNMLIPHEFSLPDLTAGVHTLAIHVRPTVQAAAQAEGAFGDLASTYAGASLHIRKPGHSFGWDIAPRLLSGGLWRAARLEYRPQDRIAETYLATASVDVAARCAQLLFYYRLTLATVEMLPTLRVRVEGVCDDSRFMQEWPVWHTGGKHAFTLTDAQLWWPKNRGPQSLYTVTVTLYAGERVLDVCTFRHGVRTVELRRVHGEPGDEYFGFIVNNEPVFINGTNWVPADAFHSRDAGRIDRMLELADDCGCNMLRCWGGNVYEDEPFFDRCDERGILVWQDFAMACGCYPQHASMQEQLRRETTVIVKKLRQHPSLALWAGDNECDMFIKWAAEATPRDPNGNVLTRRVLPEVLLSHDGMRPYLPSSPYVDELDYARGNDELMENHLWGSRVYYKGDEYDNSRACFASEMGYHGCPSPASIRRFISPERQWPADSYEWILHGTCTEPDEDACYGFRKKLMFSHVKLLFGREMESLEAFALASQISQMEAYKHFIELFRAHKDRRRGIIWWNLIDCWPQFSDAVVDYYFVKKLAFQAIRQVQKPVAMLFREPDNGRIPLMLANDTRAAAEVAFTVYRAEAETLCPLETGCVTVEADGLQTVCTLPEPTEPTVFLAEWHGDGGEGRNYFLSGRPPYDIEWVKARLAQCGVLCPEGFEESTL